MSSSLLKKSLKLFEDNEKGVKLGIRKKSNKKRKLVVVSDAKREEFIKKNVESNLRAIKLLNHYSVSKEVSEKIIKHVAKADIQLEDKPAEETVFTEADFEAFEKEYQVD